MTFRAEAMIPAAWSSAICLEVSSTRGSRSSLNSALSTSALGSPSRKRRLRIAESTKAAAPAPCSSTTVRTGVGGKKRSMWRTGEVAMTMYGQMTENLKAQIEVEEVLPIEDAEAAGE